MKQREHYFKLLIEKNNFIHFKTTIPMLLKRIFFTFYRNSHTQINYSCIIYKIFFSYILKLCTGSYIQYFSLNESLHIFRKLKYTINRVSFAPESWCVFIIIIIQDMPFTIFTDYCVMIYNFHH